MSTAYDRKVSYYETEEIANWVREAAPARSHWDGGYKLAGGAVRQVSIYPDGVRLSRRDMKLVIVKPL